MNNVDFKNIGSFIRTLRNERELTVEELARFIGVSKPAISQWENGNGIKVEMLYLLARFFNLTVEELIKGKKNNEPNKDFIKRMYDLTLYDFDSQTLNNKKIDVYYSHLKQIKESFFMLLKQWINSNLKDEENEIFQFIKKYFQRNDRFLAYLDDKPGIILSYKDKKVKEIIKGQIEELKTTDEKIIDWELEKFYSFKQEYLKIDLVIKTNNTYLLEKVLSVMTQVEKDKWLAVNLKKEVKEEENLYSSNNKKIIDLTIDEIERSPFIKIMLNNGCNCMKHFHNNSSTLDKEVFEHLEKVNERALISISINDDIRPYIEGYGGHELVGSLLYWETYSYTQYKSFIDTRKTDYYKALVNYKNDDPIDYYKALKKYYGETE